MFGRRFAFALCVLALSVAVVAADERTVWKYDKGSFEKQADGKWVQKEGNKTTELVEKLNAPDHISLFDGDRKVTVRLGNGEAVLTQQGKKAALEKIKGGWVRTTPDTRGLFKYEGGSFTLQANGMWVQKEGDKTYTYMERERLINQIEMYDGTRKVAVRITKDSAAVYMANKGLIETLKGEWVAVELPKGKEPKVDPKAVVGRTAWKYDKGFFLKSDGKWIHKAGKVLEEYEEGLSKVGYVELKDKEKNITVRLMRDSAVVLMGLNPKPLATLKGEWVDPELVRKDLGKVDPKVVVGSGKFTEVATLKRTGQAGSFAIAPSPDGKHVAMLYGALLDAPFAVVNMETKKADKSWKLPYYVDKTAWSADGKTLVGATLSTALRDGKPSKVYVWDVTTGEQKAEFDFDGFPGSLATSADCTVVAVAGNTLKEKGLLKVWDVTTKKELLERPINNTTTKIAMSADGKILAVSGTGTAMVPNQVSFYDLPSGKLRGAIPCRADFIMSGDGNTVVEWVHDATNALTVNVWNLKANAKAPRVIKGGKWHADTVTFLNNDQHIALGGGVSDDEVRVFDLKTLTEFDTFKISKPRKGLTRNYVYIRASADSSHLMTYSSDGFLRMWTTPFGPKPEAPMPKDKKE